MSDTIEQVKQAIDITDYISRFVNLKRAGKNYIGICPFHNEKTPSFIVSPELQIYKCFGCGASGDIINFAQEFEGLEFKEALEKLAKEAGITLQQKQESSFNKTYLKILDLSNKYFTKQLYKNSNHFALKYLHEKRKFTDKTIKFFNIGYAPRSNDLLKYLSKYFSEKELITSGIAIKTKRGLINRFNKRITFPLIDTRGRIIGFTGRKLNDSDFGPKYMHSPENNLFKKRFFLYGLYYAKKGIRDNNLCIFCEGTTDVISAWQNGYTNFVAPLGTGITDTQIDLAGRYSNALLFLMDSDTAGQNSLERILNLTISNNNINTYGATPYPYKDVDELLKINPDLLKDVIDRKEDLFSIVLANKLKDLNLKDPKDLQEVLLFIREHIKKITDPAQQDLLIEKASNLTKLDKTKLLTSKNTRKPTNNNSQSESSKKVTFNKEVYFLALIFTLKPNSELLNQIKPISFFNTKIRNIIKNILQTSKSSINYEKNLNFLKEKDYDLWKELSLLITHLNENNLYTEKDFLILYNQIKSDTYKKWLEYIRGKLAIAETLGNEKEIETLTNKINKLTKEFYE